MDPVVTLRAGSERETAEEVMEPPVLSALSCAKEALFMPTVWVEFRTRQESDRAIDRLEFAGFERKRIDRIEAADGRWKVGIYVDEEDAPSVRGVMLDPSAPVSMDVLNALLIFGVAATAGFILAYLMPRGFDGGTRSST
jgi:hypothetical protein